MITDEVRKLIVKSEHALEVAEILLDKGHHSDAASKTYYAMFYAAQSLLKSEGINVIKHSAVESAFGYYFAKTGKIDASFHRMLLNARKIREIADYDLQEEIVEADADLSIKEGRLFLNEIRQFLKV